MQDLLRISTPYIDHKITYQEVHLSDFIGVVDKV